ncbi:hypothetical protein, partial [Anaerocolumna jejuensis]|uniref:hypothetical protein n=1 Tax=Anaerocolumna jejuensis TaxID=259063 RepID=UPI001A9A48F4
SSDSGIILPRNSCRHLSVIRELLNRKLQKVSQNHLGVGNKPLDTAVVLIGLIGFWAQQMYRTK